MAYVEPGMDPTVSSSAPARPASAPCAPITEEVPVVQIGPAGATAPRRLSDAQRALIVLAVVVVSLVLVGLGAIAQRAGDDRDCRYSGGLFDDAEAGLFEPDRCEQDAGRSPG